MSDASFIATWKQSSPFKFKIGDYVKIAGPKHAYLSGWTSKVEVMDIPPQVGIVVERIMQECPGGVQLKYAIRQIGIYSRDGRITSLFGGLVSDVLEMCLAPYEVDEEVKIQQKFRDSSLDTRIANARLEDFRKRAVEKGWLTADADVTEALFLATETAKDALDKLGPNKDEV